MDTLSLCTKKNNASYTQHTDVVVYLELFKMRGGILNKTNIFFKYQGWEWGFRGHTVVC